MGPATGDRERRPVVILGAGRGAVDIVDFLADAGAGPVAAFVDDSRGGKGERHLDRPVLTVDEAAPLATQHRALSSIGTTRRRGLIERAMKAGFAFETLVHPAAHVSRTARIGEGTVVAPGVVVGAGARIAPQVFINRGALVGHGVVAGSYVTIGPGSNLGSDVVVGEGAYLGMGCVVLQRLTIGANAVLGAGAVVTRNVAANTQVMGVPARVVRSEVGGL